MPKRVYYAISTYAALLILASVIASGVIISLASLSLAGGRTTSIQLKSSQTNDSSFFSTYSSSLSITESSTGISSTTGHLITSSYINSSSSYSAITNDASTGVIVPLFTNDTSERASEIEQLIQIKLAYPGVPVLVVYDDHGGPGNYSTDAQQEITRMLNAGIMVLGYVPTWWGERNISAVESAINNFRTWYGVNGIYLDQMPNWDYNAPNGSWYYSGPGGEFIPNYFSNLTEYAKSIGIGKVVANAGADVPQDFLGSVDTIGTFENPFLPSLNLTGGWLSIAGLNGWHAQYSKTNFMFFSYDVPSINSSYVLSASKYVGYMYITSGNQTDDRYSQLSPYLTQLVTILANSTD